MTIPKLRLLLHDARIKPAVNQMEAHPHFEQTELVEYFASKRYPCGRILSTRFS